MRILYSDATAAQQMKDLELSVEPRHSAEFYAANKKAKQIQRLPHAEYDREGRSLFSRARAFHAIWWEDCCPIPWARLFGGL